MAFGIYIHIPYCIQRCHYCDFTTFEKNRILPPKEYVSCLLNEIRSKHTLAPTKQLDTIYFGGGTPSLIDASLIVAILNELANVGFQRTKNCEVTLEINPATVDENKLQIYLKNGVNRFSVGAQTFDDQLLQICGREHSAEQTKTTLALLQKHHLNYSFDLLFALPNQRLKQLQHDLDIVESFNPPHLSAYCLTVPKNHSMNSGRPIENEQIQMFRVIERHLKQMSLYKYEISNFAKHGFESQHNLLYWQDQPYLSFGVSAHSYTKTNPWGERFWNSSNLNEYVEQHSKVTEIKNCSQWPTELQETLKCHEALTDYCHTSLRLTAGLNKKDLQHKFGTSVSQVVLPRLYKLQKDEKLISTKEKWQLSPIGQDLSNSVFQELTFLSSDLPTPLEILPN